MENVKAKVKWNDIYDSSNRTSLIFSVGKSMGLSEEDMELLVFMALGNTGGGNLPEILRKMKLPKADFEYDKDKLEKYREHILKQMKDFDHYGILDMSQNEINKMAVNHKWLTVYSAKIDPVIYMSVYRLLKEKPEYVVSVMAGIRNALDVILNFIKKDD